MTHMTAVPALSLTILSNYGSSPAIPCKLSVAVEMEKGRPEDDIPLLNTEPIKERAIVPPNVVKNSRREITGAIEVGWNATPWSVQGMNLIPVPTPVSPIIP